MKAQHNLTIKTTLTVKDKNHIELTPDVVAMVEEARNTGRDVFKVSTEYGPLLVKLTHPRKEGGKDYDKYEPVSIYLFWRGNEK